MNVKGLYIKYKECGGKVTTDSRAIHGGEMFFALKGENFDGNDYAVRALEAGAKYAVVSRGLAAFPPEFAERLIPVDDTLAALQALARWHRSATFVDCKPLKVIALTGTNGKTTTKELIRDVLATKYVVTATEGNLNNNIGVPLTLLKINSETQIAVVEMGASHPGDINELTAIALPNYGLITNVGKAHLLGFGSFEGVMKTKGELYDYIQRTTDPVFLNADNPHLCKMASQRPDLRIIPYGLAFQGASLLPISADHPFLRIRLADGQTIETGLVGAYNADNVMAAMAVGREFGVEKTDAIRAIEAYVPSNNRSQMVQTASNTLIVDAYNANPTSMEAALSSLETVQAESKAVMLGNMLELEEESVAEHVKVIERIRSIAGLDLAVLVGGEFRKALDQCGKEGKAAGSEAGEAANLKATAGPELLWFNKSEEVAQYLKEHPLKSHCVLIKGSRGSKMENVIAAL